MQKLKQWTTIIPGLMAVFLFLPSLSFAANFRPQSSPQAAPTMNYKGEAPAKTAHYKGEVRTKLVLPAKPRPALVPIILQEGPYVGISGGYDSYKIQEFSSFGGTTNSTYNPTINATGLIGAFTAGYGHYFNTALYLGFEAFANISEAYQSTNSALSDSTDDITYNSKFFVSMGYGAALLPGVKLSDSALFFLRLGYQVARLRGQENLEDSGTLLVSNTSSWSGGFSYGLGFEEAMVENFSLRGDYVHTDYRSFTATSGTQYSPSNNQFLLSLIYHIT